MKPLGGSRYVNLNPISCALNPKPSVKDPISSHLFKESRKHDSLWNPDESVLESNPRDSNHGTYVLAFNSPKNKQSGGGKPCSRATRRATRKLIRRSYEDRGKSEGISSPGRFGGPVFEQQGEGFESQDYIGGYSDTQGCCANEARLLLPSLIIDPCETDARCLTNGDDDRERSDQDVLATARLQMSEIFQHARDATPLELIDRPRFGDAPFKSDIQFKSASDIFPGGMSHWQRCLLQQRNEHILKHGRKSPSLKHEKQKSKGALHRLEDFLSDEFGSVRQKSTILPPLKTSDTERTSSSHNNSTKQSQQEETDVRHAQLPELPTAGSLLQASVQVEESSNVEENSNQKDATDPKVKVKVKTDALKPTHVLDPKSKAPVTEVIIQQLENGSFRYTLSLEGESERSGANKSKSAPNAPPRTEADPSDRPIMANNVAALNSNSNSNSTQTPAQKGGKAGDTKGMDRAKVDGKGARQVSRSLDTLSRLCIRNKPYTEEFIKPWYKDNSVPLVIIDSLSRRYPEWYETQDNNPYYRPPASKRDTGETTRRSMASAVPKSSKMKRRKMPDIIVPSHTTVECALCGLYYDSESCSEDEDNNDTDASTTRRRRKSKPRRHHVHPPRPETENTVTVQNDTKPLRDFPQTLLFPRISSSNPVERPHTKILLAKQRTSMPALLPSDDRMRQLSASHPSSISSALRRQPSYKLNYMKFSADV